jgi:hypothetical protein
MPKVDLPADEHLAAIAAIRGLIEADRYPHARRLDPLRAALARLEAAAQNSPLEADNFGPPPKAAPAGKGDKRPRR